MGKIKRLDTIRDYNDELGIETTNELVNVVDTSKLEFVRHGLKLYGFYCVFLKHLNCGTLQYGRNQYDYDDGTLVFVAPGQVAGIDDDEVSYHYKGWILMFHPDLLKGMPLEKQMKDYSFFSYFSNEALHMSAREEQTVLNCFDEIETELKKPADKHTRKILLSNIEVFLNHCLRFYDRQFATREPANKEALTRLDSLLNGYFNSDNPKHLGLPTVSWCADQAHLSANYFGDLVKKETGRSAHEYIQSHIIERAKELLFSSNDSVSEISYSLGFQYPHHLSRMFKKVVGISPSEFRSSHSRA